MRKLVFMLKVNPNPRSTTPKNLEISTHKGARLTIVGNHATVLDVTNDEMSDNELQTWYRSRYSGLGMGITIMHDPEVKVSAPVQLENKTDNSSKSRSKRQSKKEKAEKSAIIVKEPEIMNEPVKTEVTEVKVSEVSEVQQVAKVEPKNTEETNLNESASVDDAGAIADLQSFIWG